MVNHRPHVAAIRIEVALENREALPDFISQIRSLQKKTKTKTKNPTGNYVANIN